MVHAEGNLGVEYQRCANRAQQKDVERRARGLRVLTMPDGRKLVFSKAARSKIPVQIIEYIRCGCTGTYGLGMGQVHMLLGASGAGMWAWDRAWSWSVGGVIMRMLGAVGQTGLQGSMV